VVFVGFPGLLGTLRGLISIGGGDSSISTRTSDYAFVDPFIRDSPWLGFGPGAFLPRFRLLDNQYLLSLVEMGLIGLLAVIAVFGAIVWLGRGGRRRFAADGDRFLGQMFAGAGFGIFAAAITFDGLKYLMFTAVVALLLGLAGRYWYLGREEQRPIGQAPESAAPPPAPGGPLENVVPPDPAAVGTARLRETLLTES
jgi:O-antigen ligase